MDQTVNEGDTAFFTCQVTGEPIPNIIWYFNDVPIINVNKYDISQSPINATTLSSILMIMNVQSSDVGTYTCNATNVVSSDTSSGVLTVNGELLLFVGCLNYCMIFDSCSKNCYTNGRTTV